MKFEAIVTVLWFFAPLINAHMVYGTGKNVSDAQKSQIQFTYIFNKES